MQPINLSIKELIRYVVPHWLAGCAAGVIAATALVATNLGSLRDLMWNTQGGWLGFVLLVFGFVVTFGSIAIGAAIMSLSEDDD
jgi:hypothetical protein